MANENRLDSWKEIAAYLRRSVRTARRWEAQEGLPVHRQMHQSLASVYAYKSEIDAWLKRAERSERAGGSEPEKDQPPITAENSIAVLPFAYVGPEPSHEYLADGFTDEVIGNLSKVKALRVISRTSSMALKSKDWDARSIGRRLEVGYLLEGTVREDLSRLKVSARLIDPQRDDRVWAGEYSGTVDDVFGIQEQIARRIVEALEVRLSVEEEGRLGAALSARNPMAWQCVQQARQEAFRWRRDAIDHAVQLLTNGIATVGDDAYLYAALGRVHLQYREAGIDLGPKPLEQAERCVAKVFELEPDSGPGFQLRGWLHYANARIQDAVRDLKAAKERDGNQLDTVGLLANCYLISGRVGVARPLIDRLLSIDPLTPLNRCLPGFADAMEGRFESAVGPYREMLEMDPGNPLARLFLTWILAVNDRPEEVAEVAAGFPSAARGSLPERIAALFARSLADGPKQGEATLDRDSDRMAASNDLFPRFLAQAYALAGEEEQALRWLTRAVDRGFVNYPYLSRHDPFLRSLVQLPEFESLLQQVRERWEAFKT